MNKESLARLAEIENTDGLLSDQSAKRFWSFVKKTKTCWLWTGGKNRHGYGYFWGHGKSTKSHRWSYLYHKRPTRRCKICLKKRLSK